MNNKKRLRIGLSVLLIVSLANFFRMSSKSEIRTVDMLSIFAVGVLVGMLISLTFLMRDSDQE